MLLRALLHGRERGGRGANGKKRRYLRRLDPAVHAAVCCDGFRVADETVPQPTQGEPA